MKATMRSESPRRTTSRDTNTMIATGKVKLSRAMGILLRSHPFHGHVAAGWRARPEPNIETMGVSWVCGGVQLLWSPQFVNGISDVELAGVLLHEVHHIVLRHPFLFPEERDLPPDFDAFAALVAEEVTVNEFVTLPLPGSPMRLEDFATDCPALQPLQSTRDRYRLLYDAARARRGHQERERFKKTVQDQLEQLLAARHAAAGGEGSGTCKLPDSHAGWESFRRGGAAAALAVSVATAQALARHGHALSPELDAIIRKAHAALGGAPGTTSGGVLETLAGTAQARLSWQKILRRLLAVDQTLEPSYHRPSRRFPDLVGVLPGTRRVPTRLKMLAAIDTSGSMASATLDEIAAELRVMAQTYDVSVVEFDVTIQRRYRLNQPAGAAGTVAADPLHTMQGRGGTSFFPVFERETLTWAADGGELSGVVCFTDGYGPAPKRPPRQQVIWVLLGTGVRQPACWGTVVNPGQANTPLPISG